MDRQRDFRSKVIDIKGLIRIIKPGNRIFLSSGPAWPAHSVKSILEAEEVRYFDLEFIQLFSISDLASLAEIKTNFRHISFRTGEAIPEAISHHKSIDFIPANLMEIPFMFETGTINVDMAIITASPPDSRGYMSLGVAIDVARIVMRKAGIVIVEVNPNMPVTYGDTSIHVNQADYFIESQEPLPERRLKPVDPVLDRIGWHISNLIQDNSSVVLHVGAIFDAVAHYLKTKKNLGVVTNVISDWVIGLIDPGPFPWIGKRPQEGRCPPATVTAQGPV